MMDIEVIEIKRYPEVTDFTVELVHKHVTTPGVYRKRLHGLLLK